MNQETNLATVLVEFDSIRGPVIRKKMPEQYDFPDKSEIDSILLWILRASEFSVRKIASETAYAKSLELSDPYFNRKKRQFGIVLITKNTIELKQAEGVLNKIINQCKKEGENKSYFKMLYNLLQVLNNINQYVEGNSAINESQQLQAVSEKTNNTILHSSAESKLNNQFLLMSNRLNIFNKINLEEKNSKMVVIISTTEYLGKVKEKIGEIVEASSDRYILQADLRHEIPEGLSQGLEILLKIIEILPRKVNITERLLGAIEFFDRLLYEEVDIEYYLPFVQYFLFMENFTITEFKTEEFEQHLPSLMETHGDWIKCLSGKILDGKRLSEFFKLTGYQREGLELLIDLLFIKQISLF